MFFKTLVIFYQKHFFKIYTSWLLIGLFSNFFVYFTNEPECLVVLAPTPASQRSLLNTNGVNTTCLNDLQCGNGRCELGSCVCDPQYITVDTICDYELRSQLVTFLISFFVGTLGVDWFYLARGNSCYNCGGAGKLLTCGGCCIWWLVDW